LDACLLLPVWSETEIEADLVRREDQLFVPRSQYDHHAIVTKDMLAEGSPSTVHHADHLRFCTIVARPSTDTGGFATLPNNLR
jgi:hypothetical protein